MSAAPRLLVAQKDKPESERLRSTKVVEILNEEFKSTLNSSTVRRYVNQGHIGCGCLKREPCGTVVDDDTYPHRWELPGNYPVFTVVMVIYHYVERI